MWVLVFFSLKDTFFYALIHLWIDTKYSKKKNNHKIICVNFFDFLFTVKFMNET